MARPDPDEIRKLKETIIQLETMLQALDDRMALEDFRSRKAAQYFNDRAAKNPKTAENSQHLAAIFQQAAAVNKALVKESRSPTVEESAALRRKDRVFRHLGAELEVITAHAFGQIDEFIAEDKARWQRMEKSMPEMVAEIRRHGKAQKPKGFNL